MRLKRDGSTTRYQTVLSSIIFFGTIIVVAMLVAMKKAPKEAEDTRKAPLVETVQIPAYRGDIRIHVTGVALPFREVTMAAEVTGVITEKKNECRAGTYVSANQHLLSIDSQKYSLALERAKSEVAEAESRLKKIELDLKAAKEILELTIEDLQYQSTEKEKREQLFLQKAISETELNQARRNYIAAQNAEKTQRTRVATLQADVEAQKSLLELKKVQQQEKKIDFDKAIIRAPSDGVVISEDVQKDDFVQVGQPLLKFEDTSAIEIKCDLRSDQLYAVLQSRDWKATPENRFKLPRLDATITYRANDRAYVWNGKLDRYDGLGLDERTRTAPCRILVKNTLSTDGHLTLVRGMYVSVELNLGPRDGLMALPAEAVRAGNEVWLYDKGKLRKKRIKVNSRIVKDSRELVIAQASKSIQLGDQLIISPIPQPVDGMELRLKADSAGDAGSSQSDGDSKSKSAGADLSDSNRSARFNAVHSLYANQRRAG